MAALLLALLVGVVAGLRAFSAPAAVSWAAFLGWLPLAGTSLAFIGSGWAVGTLTLLALVEFVTDQLPSTPSRTIPLQFGVRIIAGALSGATLGVASGALVGGGIAGVAGAVIGTLGGSAVRAKLAAALRKDRSAAFIEDVVAIVAVLILVTSVH